MKIKLPIYPAIPFLGIYQNQLKQDHKEVFVHPCSYSLIYNIDCDGFQEMETINTIYSRWWLDIEMAYMHTMEYYEAFKKGTIIFMLHNMNKLCIVKLNKPVKKRQSLNNSTYYIISIRSHIFKRVQWWLWGAGWKGKQGIV